MSELAITYGFSTGAALIFWASHTLSNSESKWWNWIGMILFSFGLITVLGVFVVVNQIANANAYTSIIPITEGWLIITSVLIILWAIIIFFWGIANLLYAGYKEAKQYMARVSPRGERRSRR